MMSMDSLASKIKRFWGVWRAVAVLIRAVTVRPGENQVKRAVTTWIIGRKKSRVILKRAK